MAPRGSHPYRFVRLMATNLRRCAEIFRAPKGALSLSVLAAHGRKGETRNVPNSVQITGFVGEDRFERCCRNAVYVIEASDFGVPSR
jgi:hypothetical protein